MGDEEPDLDSVRRFEMATGIEVVIHGDESRAQLARRVIDQREAVSGQAVRLLKAFMRDTGEYHQSSIEVFAEKEPDGGDFTLRYTFVADRDPHEYNYTYFEVCVSCGEPPAPPFWPIKFTVGFH